MEFYFPTRIIINRGSVRENWDKLGGLGKRCLIVTGCNSAKKCGALDDAAYALKKAGVSYEVFSRITQNPRFTDCAEGAKAAVDCKADFILGIGGGSPLDAGKAIAWLAANPGSDEQQMYSQTLKNKPLPFAAIGTTAGTGSEVTQVAVITGTDGRKKSIRSEFIFPVIAFGDPAYTSFMPEHVTRSTAVDALSHCIESYFNKASTAFSEMYALCGARIITEILSQKLSDFSVTEQQRDMLYLASVFGGMAISVTGTCIPHALSYFLTENHGVAHGNACAFWLPFFIQYNQKYAPERAGKFFDGIRMKADEFVLLVENTAQHIDITVSADELEMLRPRWKNNGSILKALGRTDNEYIENLLKKSLLKEEKE